MPDGLRVLLTGGGGFLGSAILRETAKPGSGVSRVRVLDLDCSAVEPSDSVETITGDVCDFECVRDACRDVDVVVHAASQVDWGQTTPEHLEAVNVGGTENVVRACRENGVRGLVYTSTMDVVCGSAPVVDADETMPFPQQFTNDYARTKARAEEVALAANGDDLATCAVRPCGMYGERDPYHVANVLEIVKQGSLPFRPGDGSARFQHVYVGNVAHAHLLALRQILAPESGISGEAWFITDDTPAVNFFDFMDPILEALGYALPPRSRRVPYPVMLTLGAATEAAAFLCRPFFRFQPTLTRSSVRFVCHDHTFDGSKARRQLGYTPAYEEGESIERTIAWWRSQEAR
jgi:sterol-4alpha-carboxylate 3-dehydrogenase (decarboxylating)